VVINTICGLLGDYSKTAPMETFTATNNDRHPPELAMLRGARPRSR
jgi:putative DNA primase/helicase